MSDIADRDWRYVWVCPHADCGKRFHSIWRLHQCVCPHCGRLSRLADQTPKENDG